MKKPRVSVIKDNIKEGDSIPQAHNDGVVGKWIDNVMESKGHTVDKTGVMDLPEYGIDNKSRKKGSKTPHSIGSQTIEKWEAIENFEDTDIYKKVQNQNQITYSTSFNVITDVRIIDFDIDIIQEALKDIYKNIRQKIVEGDRRKCIYSDCKRATAECYTHENSYKLRLTDKFMTQIKNLAGSRDTFTSLFEFKQS